MRKLLLVPLLGLGALLLTSMASTSSNAAGVLAFDRGLPTANLNNAAGDNRSNTAWSQGDTSVTGDTFSLGAAGETWIITGIRTWNIGHLGNQFGDDFTDDTVYIGTSGIAPVATGTVPSGSSVDSNPNITHTPVTYTGGANYESQTVGSFRQMWQNDFTNLNVTVQGGTTYYVAADGTSPEYAWFNHFSNAALSGSPQQGADNHYFVWDKSNLAAAPDQCDSNVDPPPDCNGGWDKSSDMNVQIFAYKVGGSISVTKELYAFGGNSNDKFNLLVDGQTYAAGVGNGGTTGAVPIAVGPHVVSETAEAPASLGNYRSSVICIAWTASNAVPLRLAGFSLFSPSANVTVNDGETVACFVFNLQAPNVFSPN